MRIYLADLFHTYQVGHNTHTSPYTVPLGIGFLASVVKRYLPSCDVHLFRDPDRFLGAVRAEPPLIAGFSLCSWNADLTRRVLALIKAISPGVITVGGGPSVDDSDEQIREIFEMYPTLDYLVPNEGESGLLALIQAIASGIEPGEPVPGVAYMKERILVRGRYERPIVPDASGLERVSPKQVQFADPKGIQLPSPYLDGTLDAFLDEGLVPIIQTMRGCPYQCHFCASGATEWNRMRGFDIERVKGEIDYALSRSNSKDLILTDENWGILGDRDVELARFIAERSRAKGAPTRLYYYTAKIVTPASREIVEMVAPIAWIGEFSMSFQSLNPQTRKVIKRTNIGLDKLAANTQWAYKRGIPTSSEMIYGFPHETPDTFFSGIEQLLISGIDIVQIFSLQLFPGIDLAGRLTRETYGFQTRFRLTDGAFGIYDNGNLVSAETEEIVFTNRWSTEDDYFLVRRFGFFQQVVQGRLYLSEFFRLCMDLGVPAVTLIRHLATKDYFAYPAMDALVADHHREAAAELSLSSGDVCEEVFSRVRNHEAIGGVRLNLVYLGKLFSSSKAVGELLGIIRDYADDLFAKHPHKDVIRHYLSEVLPNRIVVLSPDSEDQIKFQSRFDYFAWSKRKYRDASALLLAEPHEFVALTPTRLKNNLRNFNVDDRSDLQSLFERTPSKFLLRSLAA
jgi:radical SAM superfamily enzyme YgiQ (UPF0313 family)